MSVSRRSILALTAAGIAAPRLAGAQGANVLRFIPQIDLAFLDPHFTTAYVTRGHGHMVFDMLYGSDASFNPHPQMVQGHTVENDGKPWKLTLRPNLYWHDGERVTARDCVAWLDAASIWRSAGDMAPSILWVMADSWKTCSHWVTAARGQT